MKKHTLLSKYFRKSFFMILNLFKKSVFLPALKYWFYISMFKLCKIFSKKGNNLYFLTDFNSITILMPNSRKRSEKTQFWQLIRVPKMTNISVKKTKWMTGIWMMTRQSLLCNWQSKQSKNKNGSIVIDTGYLLFSRI